MSARNKAGGIPKAKPLELAGHLAWKERIFNEDSHAAKSLKKGIALGIVEKVPIVQNAYKSPSDRYDDDEFFQGILQESKSKFPAKSLLGLGMIGSPRFLHKLHQSKKILNNTVEAPFGLYPKGEEAGFSVNRSYMMSPVFTSIKTYAGKNKLPYMKSSINLAHPEIKSRKLCESPKVEQKEENVEKKEQPKIEEELKMEEYEENNSSEPEVENKVSEPVKDKTQLLIEKLKAKKEKNSHPLMSVKEAMKFAKEKRLMRQALKGGTKTREVSLNKKVLD